MVYHFLLFVNKQKCMAKMFNWGAVWEKLFIWWKSVYVNRSRSTWRFWNR